MKQLLVFLFLLCTASVSAQDVIVKKDGSTIVCRVVELSSSEITYKKWSDLNGSNYVMNRADASAINYENGKKVKLSEVMNLYQPNNQNDGTQQYNDKALLLLDNKNNYIYRKVKNLKTIGWIGGGVFLVAGGVVCMLGTDDCVIVGGAIAGGSLLWTPTFLLLADSQKKKIDKSFQSMSLWHKSIVKLNNGAELTAGVDVLVDNINQKQLLGLGLNYSF